MLVDFYINISFDGKLIEVELFFWKFVQKVQKVILRHYKELALGKRKSIEHSVIRLKHFNVSKIGALLEDLNKVVSFIVNCNLSLENKI